jgi:7-cyano-7-deazaguanine synthase
MNLKAIFHKIWPSKIWCQNSLAHQGNLNMQKKEASEAAIVLLSGGLDSTIALADTLSRMPVSSVLTFNYGQRAVQQELKATQAIAAHYQVQHRIIALPWVQELLPKALQQGDTNPPASALSQAELFDVERVWVPNRNGLFLNIAACFAEAANVNTIVFGANAEEGQDFPDNTPAFRDALNKTLAYSTLSGVRVETPVGQLNKADIIQLGIALNVPFHLIWSCYENQEQQCGQCPSCLRVKAARDAMGELTGQPVALSFNAD